MTQNIRTEKNVDSAFAKILTRKGHHKPDCAHSIVQMHSPKTYTDLIESKIVSDTKHFCVDDFHSLQS